MAAVLFIVAMGLIDVLAMRRVWRTSRADALTLAVTFIATLTIRLEVAILVGVLVSLLIYLNWATHPQVLRVVPDPAAQRRFRPARADSLLCPQLDILRIDGAVFFGSVEHIRDEIEAARASRPATRHLLLIGTGLNLIDNAGAELLGYLARSFRESGITLYLCRLRPSVHALLDRAGVLDAIGRDRVFATKDQAIAVIYRKLDAAKCAACTARIFAECQVTLPDGSVRDKPRPELTLAPPG
jgi:SulP family sulfate permease